LRQIRRACVDCFDRHDTRPSLYPRPTGGPVLFRQNQLSLPRVPQAVQITVVFDHHLKAASQQVFT